MIFWIKYLFIEEHNFSTTEKIHNFKAPYTFKEQCELRRAIQHILQTYDFKQFCKRYMKWCAYKKVNKEDKWYKLISSKLFTHFTDCHFDIKTKWIVIKASHLEVAYSIWKDRDNYGKNCYNMTHNFKPRNNLLTMCPHSPDTLYQWPLNMSSESAECNRYTGGWTILFNFTTNQRWILGISFQYMSNPVLFLTVLIFPFNKHHYPSLHY
jgi:hypothetical protein